MVHEARIRMRREGSYVEIVDGDARFVHISGDHDTCVGVLKAGSSERIEEIVDRCEALLDPEEDIIDRAEGWLVAECECPAFGTANTVRAMGCSIIWPVVVHDRFSHYHVVAPTRTRLEALLERLDEMGTLEVDRIADVSGESLDVSLSVSGITDKLTQRQLEALQAAIEAGYYERPRQSSAEELADEMGLARSTYQEHLRKAESAVMESFAGLLTDHPAIVEAADKGPGRPPET